MGILTLKCVCILAPYLEIDRTRNINLLSKYDYFHVNLIMPEKLIKIESFAVTVKLPRDSGFGIIYQKFPSQ